MELSICLLLLGICFMGICFLDARLPPHQNVSVRERLIAIVIVLAVLAFAETRSGDQIPTVQPQSNAASGQLADPPPVPEPDFPIITAAVSTSGTSKRSLSSSRGTSCDRFSASPQSAFDFRASYTAPISRASSRS